MSIINHLYNDYYSYIETCPNCGKRFECSETDQVPGFRDKDYKICPYCHAELSSSMSVEYDCRKLDKNE